MPPRTTVNTILDVIAKKSPALRAAGVLAFEIGDVKVNLCPPHPHLDRMDEEGGGKEEAYRPQSGNPLLDPSTYGLGEGDDLPGYGRPSDDDRRK